MLSIDELRFIRGNAHLWDHCWRYFSLAAGEPFLIGGCLVHFDGAHLYVNSYPVDMSGDAFSSIQFQNLIERFKPLLVWHSGPAPLGSPSAESGLHLVHEASPDEVDVCMAINLLEFDLDSKANRRKWIRRCERNGFRWTVTDASILSYKHLLMIDAGIQRIGPGPVALSLIGRLGDFLRQQQALLFEVFKGHELVAFGVVEGWFEKMDVALFSFGERNIPGAKDYLQWAMIESARSRGKVVLNSGYSISPSVMDFKRKWGAVGVTAGYYDQLWHSYRTFDARCCHWSQRLMFGISVDPSNAI